MSGPGDAVKRIFEQTILKMQGASLTIYKKWGTSEMHEISSVAVKEKNKFEFAANTNISRGDVIQINGSNHFWKVVDVDEIVQFSVIHHLDVSVVKIDELGNEIRISNTGHATFYGPVTGGVQIGGSHNTQNVLIAKNADLNTALEGLIDLIGKSNLDELEKEDHVAAVQRLGQLADKEKSSGVLSRVKEKLDFVESSVKVGKLAVEATPYLLLIGKFFGIL